MAKKKAPINPWLTTAMRNLIIKIRDSETQELVESIPGGWWVDNDRVSGGVCWKLIWMTLIHCDSQYEHNESYKVWSLRSEAIKMIDDITHTPLIITAQIEQRKQNEEAALAKKKSRRRICQ